MSLFHRSRRGRCCGRRCGRCCRCCCGRRGGRCCCGRRGGRCCCCTCGCSSTTSSAPTTAPTKRCCGFRGRARLRRHVRYRRVHRGHGGRGRRREFLVITRAVAPLVLDEVSVVVGLNGAPVLALVVHVSALPEFHLAIDKGEVAEGLLDGAAHGAAVGQLDRALDGAVAPLTGHVVHVLVHLGGTPELGVVVGDAAVVEDALVFEREHAGDGGHGVVFHHGHARGEQGGHGVVGGSLGGVDLFAEVGLHCHDLGEVSIRGHARGSGRVTGDRCGCVWIGSCGGRRSCRGGGSSRSSGCCGGR